MESEEWRERESAVSAFVMQYFAVFSEKGIVFLIFTLHSSLSNLKTSVNLVYGNTAQWGKEIRQKIRRSPQFPLCGVAP